MIREAINKANEDLISKWDKDELITIQEIMDIIKSERLFKFPVLYRGFGSTGQRFSEITNTRSSFYGNMQKDTAKLIEKILKVKNPTFATGYQYQASMFGQTYIFLPMPKDKIYHSNSSTDIMADMGFNKNHSDKELKDIADSYSISTIKNLGKVNWEVIVSSKKYYLMNWDAIINNLKSKFFKPKTDITKLIWQDVYDTLKAYLSRAEWDIKNNKRLSFEDDKIWQQSQSDIHDESKEKRLSSKYTEERLSIIKQDQEN